MRKDPEDKDGLNFRGLVSSAWWEWLIPPLSIRMTLVPDRPSFDIHIPVSL
jgi:hypothetical protein